MFAETAAVGRQDRRGHVQGHACKRQQSDFGHATSCPTSKHPIANRRSHKNQFRIEDVNKASSTFNFFGR
jgi:hypothetical protein